MDPQPLIVNLPEPTSHQQTHLYGDYYIEQSSDENIRIFSNSTKKIVFVGIKLKPPTFKDICVKRPTVEDLYALHANLMRRFGIDETSPSLTQPQHFTLPPNTPAVIPSHCTENRTLNDLPAKLFFKYVQTYDPPSRLWKEKPLYATTFFKKFIINFLNDVWVHEQNPNRPYPVLDPKLIFISQDNIIFTQYYQQRPAKANAYDVTSVLKAILAKIGNISSETLTIELGELYQWIEKEWWGEKMRDPKDVMELMVFWTPRMRCMLVRDLTDVVISDISKTYNHARKAFQTFKYQKFAYGCDWRYVVKSMKHPILEEWIRLSDSVFQQKIAENKSPHILRSDLSNTRNTAMLHGSGIVKMGDGYKHVLKVEKNLVLKYNTQTINNGRVKEIHLQHMWQDAFPKHMVELGKAKSLVKFDPIEMVTGC